MNARKKRSRTSRALRLLMAAVALIAVIAIVLIVIWIKGIVEGPPAPPRGGGPSSTTTPPNRPEAQPADCADVLTLVIPGTWESTPNDDPLNPTSKPASLLLRVSKAIKSEFPESRTEVYTVPYIAEFRNPTILNDRQSSYNYSRTQGYKRAAGKIISTHEHCPLTRYVIVGFSQGAVIGGDLASAIGNGRGNVLPQSDADLVLGVGLIADGRRQPGDQRDIGPNPPGVGAEIALAGMGSLVPGTTMTGPRPGGFGDLQSKVVSICAPGDLICDAPTASNPLSAVSQLASAINNPVHAMYATPRYWSLDGATATQWMRGWVNGLIDEAPRPAHN
ncbi:cutinase family protein [Gordonia polyisoprenivorans]|uniref:cutinase family protein n=1 Tax=Gordonia polyisoprenivorans TaxID=84595 RepID=UPI001B8D6B41|nr:cutinase family protein [Gordonia polyisoprenivorans]QUD82362.1 cutinase family protein [Gordonia polyisoprenivorans]WCB37867.1 cutinase family protein [Gordonia polyisoprenivorans]